MCDCIPAAWRMPQEQWEWVEPMLPDKQPGPKGGRPRMKNRKAMEAIFYKIRTGCQWKALPRCLGASSTVHDRFQHWQREGVFFQMWKAGVLAYDELVGLDWEWQSMDGAMSKAPLGGPATGPNPTDRAKRGAKRSLLTEGEGIPLALAVAEANRNDMKLVEATLDAIVVERPEPTLQEPQNLCLDKGYDYEEVRQAVVERRYTPHIAKRRKKGEAKHDEPVQPKPPIPGQRARRWVVERTHSWMNRFRSILIRWEKKDDNYLAALQFACAYIAFHAAWVFG